jgi:hypothetical protein
VAVEPGFELHALDRVGERASARGVLVRHRCAVLRADARGLVAGEDERLRALDPAAADRVLVDVEDGLAALAEPAAVVGELRADLVGPGG